MAMARVSERTHKKIQKLRRKISRDTGIPIANITANIAIEAAMDAFLYVPASKDVEG